MASFVILAVCFLLVLFGSLYYYLKNFKRNRLIALIPGKKTRFLFGNSLDFLGHRDEFISYFQNYVKDYKKEGLARCWLGNKPTIIIFSAKAIEPLIAGSTNLSKAEGYKYLVPWLGTGLLTSTDEKWLRRRKLLTPAFHFRILDDFAPIINEHSETLVRNLEVFAGKEQCDVFKYITLCTLDIICATAMGRNLNAQTLSDSEYVEAVSSIGELVTARAIVVWYKYDWLFYLLPSGRKFKSHLSILHKFTKTVIADKRREALSRKREPREENPSEDSVYGRKRRVAFLDLLLEISDNGKVLSDEDVQEEVDTFMFEGHDTTSSGIFWTLYQLGLNKEVQMKLHDELDGVFGDATETVVTLEQLSQLKYLDCVCKEAMRICPPVPVFGRQTTKDQKVGPYTIPAGTDCLINTFILHRDEQYFPDPEKFDPDRFLSENSTGRHPFAYLPFSAGPRNCIGQKFAMMEVKIVVSHILRAFEVITLDPKDRVRGPSELVLRPSDEIKMRLVRRSPGEGHGA